MSFVSPRTRLVLAALPAVVGVSLLAPQIAPASAAPTAASSATAATTAVTLEVTGCKACEFQLFQAIDGRPKVWTSSQKKVVDGQVSWTVPTSRLRGLSIDVRAPWDGGIGAVPNVVFRYQGKQVGDAVSRADAAGAERATGCFAGTDADTLSLPITVVHARTRAVDGSRTHTPRAYTATTQKTVAPMLRTYRGIIANQDAIYCKV